MTQEEFTERYQFNLKKDKIGGGSFGTVYLAYDVALDKEVAIKVSEVQFAGDKEFSLLEEFKAVESLPAHKNIANYERVHRYESFNGVFDYGIMQYYQQGNLSHYLKNNKVDLAKREKLVRGILKGISYLHKHKVVHRDLKPSNILVVKRGDQLIPKITDFGLSKQASLGEKASRFTNSFAGGTIQYSSPEQLKGEPLKLNTDLWSFGVIAYELFTGKTLFVTNAASTISADWQNKITEKILLEDVSHALLELPAHWQSAISLCLQRDSKTRVQTANEIIQHLETEKPKNSVVKAASINEASNKKTTALNQMTNSDKNIAVTEIQTEKTTNNKSEINKTDGTLIYEEREVQSQTIPEKKKSKPFKSLKLTKKKLVAVILSISLIFVAIIAFTLMPTDEESWNKAQTNNDIKSYEQYLNRHPNGQWKTEAVSKLYEFADKNKTIEVYQKLIKKYPNKEAESQLEKMILAEKTKRFNQLLNESDYFVRKAKKHYGKRQYKECVTSFLAAKKSCQRAMKEYDIDKRKANSEIAKINRIISSYIEQQKQDMELNPSQKNLYTKNINTLKQALK